MKQSITVQVTFETTVEVNVPDVEKTEDAMYDIGIEIADTLNDLTSVDFGDVTDDTIYWSKTRMEVWNESDFIGESYC